MPSFGVLREHECPRCGRPVDLPMGEMCADCARTVQRRARSAARRAAIVAVLLFGVWVVTSVPGEPGARMVAGAAALVTWVLVYLIVYRAVRTWLA